MMQSADTIPNFRYAPFDRYWERFVNNRKAEEYSAAIDRRNFKAAVRQLVYIIISIFYTTLRIILKYVLLGVLQLLLLKE